VTGMQEYTDGKFPNEKVATKSTIIEFNMDATAESL
jgi:hypothetical protein